jgi:hypothetical protein
MICNPTTNTVGYRAVQTIHRWLAAGLMGALCGCASEPSYTVESVIATQQAAAAQNTAPRNNTTTVFVPPAATVLTNVASQDYRGINLDHSITRLSDGGKVVVLDDGSTWQISPVYQSKTLLWAVTQKVVVTPGGSSQYSYQLANGTTKEAVQAQFTGGAGAR